MRERTARRALAGFWPVLLVCCWASTASAKPGDLVALIPFSTVAPQDIAYDPDEEVYWVTSFLDNAVHKYSGDMAQELEKFSTPTFESGFLTGVAYNPHDGTVFFTEVLSGVIHEMNRTGGLTGREIIPELPPDFPGGGRPVLRGMCFDPTGDRERGSLYIVETTAPVILEVDLEGRLIRHFSHPDDSDGFASRNDSASTTDISCIYDNAELVGFYLTGGPTRLDQLRRLDRDGVYEGVSIPVAESGGNVSGVVRRPFPHPESGELIDAYLCAVESNAEFALLEGGEPSLREVVGLQCQTQGRDVILTWSTFQQYDRIEIRRDCELLATLPGDAETWRGTFNTDGVYEFTLSAIGNSAIGNEESTTPPACLAVIGAGRVLRSDRAGTRIGVDLAVDGRGFLYVTDSSDREIVIYDAMTGGADGFPRLASLPVQDAFLGEEETLTGIAYDSQGPNRMFIFNATRSTVGILDDVGVLTSIFEVDLPILDDGEVEDPEEPPDRGLVEGITYDAVGDEGRGSLWLVETARDWIYEVDLGGQVLRSFPHPYLSVEPPPSDLPVGIASGGITTIPGSPDELFVGGGTLRDFGERHIFRVDKTTGRPLPGSAIATDGIGELATRSSFTIAALPSNLGVSIVVLTHNFSRAMLIEVETTSRPPAAPTFLEARQPSLLDEVELSFVNNGPYDSIEIFRDCLQIGTIAGDDVGYVDTGASPGLSQYRVRGVLGAVPSDFASVSIRIGPGAVLERAFAWPLRGPHQLSRDPEDDSYWLATLWPTDVRRVFHFDRSFRFLESREANLESPWGIDTLAVRSRRGAESELYLIVSEHPVPVNNVAAQRFDLLRETHAGEVIERREIFPPRPTNGFVTFPTGLTWDPLSDTFFYLERNSQTFVQMSAAGDTMREFAHPSPPFQNAVMNFGLTIAPQRRSLFFTGATRQDFIVSSALEMTLDGRLTGVEVPLRDLGSTITGISLVGDELIAVGTGRLFTEFHRLKAFAPRRLFVRGDSNDSGGIEFIDALFTLNYLFGGGPSPACEDAVDTDDDAALTLNDALVILNFFFRDGRAPAAPFPEPGTDPTADGIGCF